MYDSYVNTVELNVICADISSQGQYGIGGAQAFARELDEHHIVGNKPEL